MKNPEDENHRKKSDFKIDQELQNNVDILGIIVDDFIRKNIFKKNERQDIIQSINVELFSNKSTIEKQFKGKSSFRTYLYVIVRNICLHLVRKRKKVIDLVDKADYLTSSFNPIDNIIIEQEIERLEQCFNVFFKNRKKLELCLHLKYRILLTEEEFGDMFPGAPSVFFEKIFNDSSVFFKLTDNELFREATLLLQTNDQKKIKPNSLIKWTKIKINHIILMMNGMPPKSNYTEETLQILIEKYFHKKKNAINSKSLIKTSIEK